MKATIRSSIAALVLGCALSQSSDAVNPELAAATAVEKGIDLARYHEIVADIRNNPAHGEIEFRASGESGQIAYHSTARIGPYMAGGQELGQTRDYRLHLGLPVELQGDVLRPVDRIEPIELALAGLADCVIGTVAVHAAINGIRVDQISATVRAPLNLRVLLGIDGIDRSDKTYGKLSIDMEIKGPELTETQRLFLQEQMKRSPVFNLLSLAHQTTTAVRIAKP